MVKPERTSCDGTTMGQIPVKIDSKTTIYVEQHNKHKIPEIIAKYTKKKALETDENIVNEF